MSGTVIDPTSLLFAKEIGVWLREQIYDPTNTTAAYLSYAGKRIVPLVGSIVKNTDGTPLWVSAIDNVTYTPTYMNFIVDSTTINGVSFYNTDNARFTVYYDTRTSPYVATPDGKLIPEGLSPRSYRMVRYPGTVNETVISQYYDTTGNLVSSTIPLVKISNELNLWYLQSCRISVELVENEEIRFDIIDETGAVVRTALAYAAKSSIVNDAQIYRPAITSMVVSGNQMLPDGSCFLFQNQNVDSLHLTITLTYADGTTANIVVGKNNSYLYGVTDLLPAYPGLKADLTVRYVLGSNENVNPGLAGLSNGSIYAVVPVTVIPTDLTVPLKLSLVPVWNTGSNRYNLKYVMYVTGAQTAIDVSAFVSISSGAVDPTPASFGLGQSWTVQLDLSKVLPNQYTATAIYAQNFYVVFGPNVNTVKWTIQDSKVSVYSYGQDTVNSRRPTLLWDATLQQYFISSGVFGNEAAFLESFYFQGSPPFDPKASATPLAPTHFVIRDPFSLVQKVLTPIPVENYNSAISIVNDTAGNYVGGTVVVEFLYSTDSLIFSTLYGVPVDVGTGTYVSIVA